MGGRIVIVGSGETAPTMVKVHRALIEQAGAGASAMLDTPFGFQANADDLTEKVLEYFADSVGIRLEVARWRRRDDPVAERERSLALLQRSSFVFAGPGSPTYALRQWQETPVPRALVDVVGRGGTVVLGSAAAVTVGSHAVPVYEIYKVGEDPRWLPGLDLLGQLTGIPAAVIPHFDNREGGRHDTRFCYLGSQRLEAMEHDLPEGVGVLGVDEHTAVVVDVEQRTATVHGAGVMTLRYRGASEAVPAGESIALTDLAALLSGAAHGHVATVHAVVERRPSRPALPTRRPRSGARRPPCARASTPASPPATPTARWPPAWTSRTPSTPGRRTPCRATTSTSRGRRSARCSWTSRSQPSWACGTRGPSWGRWSTWRWRRGCAQGRPRTTPRAT